MTVALSTCALGMMSGVVEEGIQEHTEEPPLKKRRRLKLTERGERRVYSAEAGSGSAGVTICESCAAFSSSLPAATNVTFTFGSSFGAMRIGTSNVPRWRSGSES